MRATTTQLVLSVLALALAATGCSSADPFVPLAPTLLPQSAPPTTTVPVFQNSFVLSGVVFETTPRGRAPVENVQVYCDACGEGHVSVQTDSSGSYRISDVLRAGIPSSCTRQATTSSIRLTRSDGQDEGLRRSAATLNSIFVSRR